MRFWLKFVAVTALAAVCGAVQAQTYPTRPIKVVSPFPAGGATDVLTRLLAERMAKDLGGAMVVENRAGAGTSIGASFVQREPADGYTILMATNSTLVTNRYLYKNLPYDPDGFDPIGMVGIGPLVLLSSPKAPFGNTKELVDYARQHPGKVTFATFGPGTSSHLAAELFKSQTGTDMLHVPFKGATQALPALISGDVDIFFDMVATGMPQADAGKVKAFGITSTGKLDSEPQLVPLAEQGYPKFDITAWFSFVAPRNTPPEALGKLRTALVNALKDETVRKKMLDMGIQPASGTPQALIAQIKSEQPVIQKLVKQANVVLQ
jgi:tripartite-type tricarboxylate transporter receptor subunit TctC